MEWNIQKDEIVGKGVFKCGITLDRYSTIPRKFRGLLDEFLNK